MIHPNKEQFMKLASKNKRIVVYREIAGDLVTPISLLLTFADRTNLFLLESANLDKSFSRFSFFGFNPGRVITYKSGRLSVTDETGQSSVVDENPVTYMNSLIEHEDSHCLEEFGSFCGGYVGFMGYDMVNYMGILRKNIREDRGSLLMAFFQVNEFYVFDNHRHKVYAACSVTVADDAEKAYVYAGRRTMEMAAELHRTAAPRDRKPVPFDIHEDFSKEEFMSVVSAVKNDITRGECIQTVISNRYETSARHDPVSLYRMMRNINPSPYMFFLKFNDEVLCGTSPETHLKVNSRTAHLKPIAGTYKVDNENLQEKMDQLRKDEKELAEHLMLLDLARNDLYTGCEPESVQVINSFEPEVYSHVIHLVSEVSGTLRSNISPYHLFCNTFPAGTVSGAPKVRAIELIDEYEKTPRGFYAGCAGYFSYNQDIDTCIIIRSALVNGSKTVLRAGAGIVYDSDPEKGILDKSIIE